MVKAHNGIYGNELADHLAKQAARSDRPVSYKLPKTEVLKTLREESWRSWEREWRTTNNGAETKKYFPSIAERLVVKIPITSGLTTIFTGHGRIRAYFHRFRITPDATCSCADGDQTIDHLLLECPKYDMERQALRRSIITKGEAWLPDKRDLIKKILKDFSKYVNKTDFTSN